MDFSEKTIAIAVTGGVAAYKVCDLIRELYRRNAQRVICVMTPNAEAFIPALTLQALSRFPVYSAELSIDSNGVPIHIVVAQQADALMILPATADVIAKLAHGSADNLVTTCAITFTGKPVLVAPAMNTRMWDHPLTRENCQKLAQIPNYCLVEPTLGHLACGETGDGHLADPETILQALYKSLHPKAGLYEGFQVIVTAGGTSETVDPVRVISNRSSGKMGLALADELSAMGAKVTLITTRPPLTPRAYAITTVQTAQEMKLAILQNFEQTDLLMMAAAVADYRVAEPSTDKIKRETQPQLTLRLAPNPDILAELGAMKRPGQLLVGFAAESADLLKNAAEKMQRKNLDAVVANDISRSDIGLEVDHNEITLLTSQGSPVFIERATKTAVARQLLTLIHEKLCVVKTRFRIVRPD